MNADASLRRWLIVVRHDRRDLFRDLRQNFASDRRVHVLLDRRQADRRAARVPVSVDQRRRERRTSPTAYERALWETAGLRLYYQDDALQVYETDPDAERRPGRPRRADRACESDGHEPQQ